MKKILCIWLIFIMLFSTVAYADELPEAEQEDIYQVAYDTMVVEPRYSYILHMSIGLEIDANGHLVYGGSARAPYRNIRITVYLQRSDTGVFWEDLAGTVKTGYDNLALEEERDLPEDDCFYRAKIVTDVYDANRNIIETATGYSSEERY